jgi:hypothetical protein
MFGIFRQNIFIDTWCAIVCDIDAELFLTAEDIRTWLEDA